MSKTIESKQFTLKRRDFAKGLLMAVLTPAIVIIQQTISAGELTFDWQTIGMAALAGGLAYLSKNLFEPSKKVTVEELPKK